MIKIRVQICGKSAQGVSIVKKEFVTELPDVLMHNWQEIGVAERLHGKNQELAKNIGDAIKNG